MASSQSPTCELCSEGELYRSRSGLNKHTTKVHDKWYRPHGNLYVPIAPEELAAARVKAKAEYTILLIIILVIISLA